MRETSLDDFIGEGGADDGGSDGDGASDGDHAGRDDEDLDEDSGAVEERDGGEVFAEEEQEEGAETGVGTEAETADVASDETDEERSVEPAASTYDWTPTGADCQDCGAVVEKRWRDDGELVCADCKAW